MLVDFMKRYTVNRDQLHWRKTMFKPGRGNRRRLIQWMAFLEPPPSLSRWNQWPLQCHLYPHPPSLGPILTGRASKPNPKQPCTLTPTQLHILNIMDRTLLEYLPHHQPQQQQPRLQFMELTNILPPLKLNQKLWNLYDLRFDLSGIYCCNCIHSLF